MKRRELLIDVKEKSTVPLPSPNTFIINNLVFLSINNCLKKKELNTGVDFPPEKGSKSMRLREGEGEGEGDGQRFCEFIYSKENGAKRSKELFERLTY